MIIQHLFFCGRSMSDNVNSIKKAVDWEAVEFEYRRGLRTLRDIAAEYGVSHGAINKKARALGWERDLSEKIRRKAETLVSKSLVSKEVSKSRLDTERAVIEANAEAILQVALGHRTLIKKARDIADTLISELEQNRDEDNTNAKARTFQTLTTSLKTVVELERQALGMDKQQVTADELADKHKIHVQFVQPRIVSDEDE